ncbi:colanic acid/amylovoran biosynthesis protein [Paenibacillus forsythiae]|uniref:Colanic acid/amylovoran biosynthesis protein n=1 Tax=Paenibacillus forsythiae TaxID=365616 RepID=A0ABU3H2X2_9BACL|nr:polysaccharide pyruvyl transferase family protein [Paenibacillus forsythiae]MDT3425167.1 colanic acid/amylovoran biosynthesis protein [Paenibacillus forsythiae]
MKSIMIHAYTKLNLGDDLFIKVLCERYPDTRFILPARKEYKQCLAQLPNLTVYPIESIWVRGVRKLLKKWNDVDFQKLLLKRLALRCDGVVQIGGSMYMQGEGWKRDYAWKLDVFDTSKPFYVLGANFGPYTDDQFYQKYRELFSTYTDICFRDEYSHELYKDLGNVRLAPDIIFQHPQQDHPGTGKPVVFSVIKPSARDSLKGLDTMYYNKIKDIAVAFIQEGHEVKLMSFCEYEGDEEAARAILSLIPQQYADRVSLYFYKTNLEEAVSLLASSSMIIATRFHAMILGWVFGKPVFPIAYSDKTIHVMNDAHFTGTYADLKTMESLEPESVVRSFDTNRLNVTVLARQAEKHFEKLDNYLGKSKNAKEAVAITPAVFARRGHES